MACVLCSVAQLCLTLCDPWTLVLQALLSMEFFLGKNTGGGCHFLLHNFCFFNQKDVCCSFGLGVWRCFRSKFDLKGIPFPLPPSLQKGSSELGDPPGRLTTTTGWASSSTRTSHPMHMDAAEHALLQPSGRLGAFRERLTDQLSCARLCERHKTIREAPWSWKVDWPTWEGRKGCS